MTYGNHARTVQNKNDNIHHDNFERIIPWWLKQRMMNHQFIHIVDHSFDNEFIVFKSCGHCFLAAHGDLDSLKQSPRLLYTLFKKQYGVDVEYILLGDKHHHESFNEMGITAYTCGSLCGSDEYANNHRLYSRPEQLMFIVNNDGVDAEYRLPCQG